MEKSPAQIAAELKAAADAQVVLEADLARQQSSYFSFGDVTWLMLRMEKQAARNPSGISVFTEIQPLIEGWLEHHYPGRLKSYSFDLHVLERTMKFAQVDANNPISFLQLLSLIHTYQVVHLEAEPMAGFSESSFKKIKARFDPYDKTGKGLKARELWAVLGDCGVNMTSQEDQHWMINLVKEMDKDHSGTIDIQEFCQLLRKVTQRRDTVANAREGSLIMQSHIIVREVEEWVPIFRLYDTDRRNALSLSQLCALFHSIGIKWNRDGNDTLHHWMQATDENADNFLDFGEFCCLIQKMVAEDFHGIRSATSGKGGGSSISTGIKPRWSPEKSIRLAWNFGNDEPSSPTLAPRQAHDWVCSTEDAAGPGIAEPISPKTEHAINTISELLAASALEATPAGP